MLTQCAIHVKFIMDKFIMKVDGNTSAIRFLPFRLGKISANMERNSSKYH